MLLFQLQQLTRACMVHLVCLFMKTHLLVLLQDNCLHCAFLRKLCVCVRNITVFCQHIQRPMKSPALADTLISAKLKHRPIYRLISTYDVTHKSETQKTFFIADSRTCQVFWGFEQLSSTITWQVMPLVKDNRKLLEIAWNYPEAKV